MNVSMEKISVEMTDEEYAVFSIVSKVVGKKPKALARLIILARMQDMDVLPENDLEDEDLSPEDF